MATLNKNLHSAKKNKNDEFYTQRIDIDNELKHYKEHFKNKTIFCNCDDPYESHFFKYFASNFNYLGLKKLIATCYNGSTIADNQLKLFQNIKKEDRKAFKIVITEVSDVNNDGAIDIADVEWLIKNDKNVLTLLKENGDFRSEECIELLKESDIVVTNPPFSLFREYVAQLIEYDKKFIIIGHQNAITYKEIFALIQENKIWLGYGFKGGAGHFYSNEYIDYATSSNHKEGMIRVSGVNWFTNLDINKRNEDLILYEKYNSEKYPKYDNYDAINIDKTKEIPMDYDGVMGVPITFLDKYNPDQFEIINGIGRYACIDNEYTNPIGTYGTDINGKHTYFRVLIKRKK